VFPVKYELGFYIPEDGILHSHCRENLKSYIYRILPRPKRNVLYLIMACRGLTSLLSNCYLRKAGRSCATMRTVSQAPDGRDKGCVGLCSSGLRYCKLRDTLAEANVLTLSLLADPIGTRAQYADRPCYITLCLMSTVQTIATRGLTGKLTYTGGV
jgi:hypothetical protein